jgi:SAM-dependent methyltransferase
VTKLETGDNFYDGYISLGVVEHREAGPEPFLAEAYRVLKPGGYALITVPYINPFRQLKSRLGFYGQTKHPDAIFYQYAYHKTELRNFLEKAGFEPIEDHGLAGYFGLREELPALFILLDRLPGGWKIKQSLKKSSWPHLFGHMLLFVCRKIS